MTVIENEKSKGIEQTTCGKRTGTRKQVPDTAGICQGIVSGDTVFSSRHVDVFGKVEHFIDCAQSAMIPPLQMLALRQGVIDEYLAGKEPMVKCDKESQERFGTTAFGFSEMNRTIKIIIDCVEFTAWCEDVPAEYREQVVKILNGMEPWFEGLKNRLCCEETRMEIVQRVHHEMWEKLKRPALHHQIKFNL